MAKKLKLSDSLHTIRGAMEVEQMELALAKTARKNDISVRANALDEIPDEHKDSVADYYRRLGQAEEATNP